MAKRKAVTANDPQNGKRLHSAEELSDTIKEADAKETDRDDDDPEPEMGEDDDLWDFWDDAGFDDADLTADTEPVSEAPGKEEIPFYDGRYTPHKKHIEKNNETEVDLNNPVSIFNYLKNRVLKSKAKTLIAAILLLGAFAGQYKIFETGLTDVKETAAAIISLVVGAAICMIKQPNYNVFRGSFAGNEVVTMVLTLVSSLFIIWGGRVICRRAESKGFRVNEISWLGSHSLLKYLYHMFFVWIICLVTGFSTKYEEPVPIDVIWKSVLLTVACLTLCVLRYVIGDRIAEKYREKS